MDESWLPVKGTDGRYEISNLGRVRSVYKSIRATVHGRGGYRRILLSKDGRRRLWMVHRLVAEAFIGDAPPGYQVNHIDSDRANNASSNLEYVTPKGNQAHSWHTTQRQPPHRGETTPFAKLTENDVIQIRRMRAEGRTYKEIAAHFNTKPANVWHICSGHTWKHLL